MYIYIYISQYIYKYLCVMDLLLSLTICFIGDSEYAFLVNGDEQRRDRVYVDAADEQKSNLLRYP
jgi:hypothetical protein